MSPHITHEGSTKWKHLSPHWPMSLSYSSASVFMILLVIVIWYLSSRKILRERDGYEANITSPGLWWSCTLAAAEARKLDKLNVKALWNVNKECNHCDPSATPHWGDTSSLHLPPPALWEILGEPPASPKQPGPSGMSCQILINQDTPAILDPRQNVQTHTHQLSACISVQIIHKSQEYK